MNNTDTITIQITTTITISRQEWADEYGTSPDRAAADINAYFANTADLAEHFNTGFRPFGPLATVQTVTATQA